MAQPVTYNTRLDPQTNYNFDLTITDDAESALDISSWSFNFIMYDSGGAIVWNIANGDFSRPTTGQITFTKSIADVSALTEGLYTIKLLVTKTGATNDVYMIGYFQR